MRTCSICGLEKEDSQFARRTSSARAARKDCKQCCSERQRRWARARTVVTPPIVHCPRCKTDKPSGEFRGSNRGKYGLQSWCAKCFDAWRIEQRARKWDDYLDARYRRTYGISLAEYRRLEQVQDALCAICGKAETMTRYGKVEGLAVDHCHATGNVRGLLCRSCNTGLGAFGDDTSRLRSAVEYIENHAAG